VTGLLTFSCQNLISSSVSSTALKLSIWWNSRKRVYNRSCWLTFSMSSRTHSSLTGNNASGGEQPAKVWSRDVHKTEPRPRRSIFFKLSRPWQDVSFPRPRRIRNNQIFKLSKRTHWGVPLRRYGKAYLNGEWIHSNQTGGQAHWETVNFRCNFSYVWGIIFSSKCSTTVWQPIEPDRQIVFVHFQTS